MEEKSLKCEICNLGCSSNQQLETHVNNVHYKRRDFKCKHCDKSYSVKNHLNVHVRIEHEEIPHLCDVCNKSFTTKEGVKTITFLSTMTKSQNVIFVTKHSPKFILI